MPGAPRVFTKNLRIGQSNVPRLALRTAEVSATEEGFTACYLLSAASSNGIYEGASVKRLAGR